jgi:serine/threonine protein phosphatase PrpC
MSKWTLSICALTDTGLKRSQNEDSHAVWMPEDKGARERQGVLLVVCDGMGGSQAGEVASRLAVDTVLATFRDANGLAPEEEIRHALEEANRIVHQRSLADAERHGMGTTCTAAVVRGREVYLAQVGDSRAYLVRHGRIQQLTRDHSLVAQLVERRELTPEEARIDPRRNVVTRSIGVSETVEVDAIRLDAPLESGDTLLLCSDGLHGQVMDDELAATVTGRDLDQASKDLIKLANERGGPDNITVVLARMSREDDTLEEVPEAAEAAGRTDGERGGRAPRQARGRNGAAGAGVGRAAMSPSRAITLLILALIALTVAVGSVLWLLRGVLSESRRLDSTRDASSASQDGGGSS